MDSFSSILQTPSAGVVNLSNISASSEDGSRGLLSTKRIVESKTKLKVSLLLRRKDALSILSPEGEVIKT